MQGEKIRECLHSGARIYGTHVAILSNTVAASMMEMAGLDFAFLCAEHQTLDRTETAALCCLYANKGISPIVRISHPSAVEAAKTLDAGAQGIVAPYVETVEQVREVVGAVRYRPIKGKFLRDLMSGERKPTAKTTEFLKGFNRHNYVIIGIESIAAIENLENLIGVEGVDGVFIGPHDVSVSMEIPAEWDNPELMAVFKDIVVRCRAKNIGVGTHMQSTTFPLDAVHTLMDAGMNWILDGADVTHAISSMIDRRKALGFGGLGEKTSGGADSSADPKSCISVNPRATSSPKQT